MNFKPFKLYDISNDVITLIKSYKIKIVTNKFYKILRVKVWV